MTANPSEQRPEESGLTTRDLDLIYAAMGIPEHERPALIAREIEEPRYPGQQRRTPPRLRTNAPAREADRGEHAIGQINPRVRLWQILTGAGIALGTVFLLGYVNYQTRPPKPAELSGLSAEDQAAARAEALKSLNILEGTATCDVELDAKAAVLRKVRELGGIRPEEPDASAYDQAAELARANNIPCGTGLTDDRAYLEMEINGAKLSILFTGDTLPDPELNVPSACLDPGSLATRASVAEPGSAHQTALFALTRQVQSYCGVPGITPAS